MYGDTYYTEKAIETILQAGTDSILFFGNKQSIVAVKVIDASVFRYHKDHVKTQYLAGKISQCKGWQVYQSFVGQDLSHKPVIRENFVMLCDGTTDINTPEDYNKLV